MRKVPSPMKTENAAGALGVREPDSDAGGNLVAHAGEAELEVAATVIGGVPYLEQVTRGSTGGGDECVARLSRAPGADR